MMLTSLDLEGEFESIPLENKIEKISLIQRNNSSKYTTEKSMTIEVNKKYPRPFLCGKGENKIKFYIHRVYLIDLKEEIKKTLDNPKLIENFSVEELKKAKKEAIEFAKELCPKGMRIPVIEYETEEASLQIYAHEYLEMESSNKSSFFILGMKPDEKTGIHGLPLKAIALEYAVPKDTTEINIEILGYYLPLTGETIEI